MITCQRNTGFLIVSTEVVGCKIVAAALKAFAELACNQQTLEDPLQRRCRVPAHVVHRLSLVSVGLPC